MEDEIFELIGRLITMLQNGAIDERHTPRLMAQRQPSREPSSAFQPCEREILSTTYTWSNTSSEFSKASLRCVFPNHLP
jgi:hypothetical protein